MSENLLQFIWRYRLYAQNASLKTMDGEDILVLHPGKLNTHAGPDFLEAKIKIGSTLWIGHIEIHIKSSDWIKHRHQYDHNYAKLILHVVYEHDAVIENSYESFFPTLILMNHIDKKLLLKYEALMNLKSFIPCEKYLTQVNSLSIHQMLDRLLAERLEEKSMRIKELLTQFQNNWQEVFYIQLARGFGLHINQEIFEQLALITPLSLLAKYKNNILVIESLLFGQAGFLYDYFDEVYPIVLQKEYAYLKKIYHLQSIEKHHWKFLRLRPANFPTLRIAQFAQIISNSNHLFSKITEAETIRDIELLFQIRVSDYWLDHYNFEERSVEKDKSLGKTFIQGIIINVLSPLLFVYGKLNGKEYYCQKSIRFLEQLDAEKNSIITQWNQLGLKTQSASETQALIQLKHQYCDAKRCLECGIGYQVLKNGL